MHGNSSARVEALTQLSLVLSLGAQLVSFDFTGSGKSDGEYVSLGAFEKDDLKCVIEHLRGLGTTSTIALWGRSMGAATALLHGERDPSIAGMVLDSAFADLQMLAEEMVEKGRQHGLFAPNFLVSIAIRMIRSSVQKAADFDIKVLAPIEHADKCFIPALFVAAEGDEFVPPHHSQRIYQKYAGDKNIIIVEGDHNSARPRFLFDSASIFLVHVLQIPDTWILNNTGPGSRPFGTVPWSSSSSRRKPASFTSHKDKSASARNARPSAAPEGAGEVGMTNERQADIRSKLYSMLGERSGTVAAAASGTGAAASSGAASSNGKQAATHPSSSSSATATAHAHLEGGVEEDEDGPGLSISAVDLLDAPLESEWTCGRCTLINAGMFEQCFACDSPRNS
jgi:alpha/beta superfamily hydrolase